MGLAQDPQIGKIFFRTKSLFFLQCRLGSMALSYFCAGPAGDSSPKLGREKGRGERANFESSFTASKIMGWGFEFLLAFYKFVFLPF